MKKRLGSMILALVMALSLSIPAGAVSENSKADPASLASIDAEILTESQVDDIRENIQSMSDEEYDAYLAEMVTTSTDHTRLRENLKLVGVNLSEIHCVQYNDSINMRNLIVPLSGANQATMYVYDSSRTASSYKRVSAAYQLNVRESRPASYDSVVLYFDSTKATYRSYSVESNYTSLKNGTQAGNGTLVFNFYDNLSGTNVSYCTVEIAPKSSATGQLFYSAVWSHSRTATDINVSVNPSVTFGGSGGVSGSIGATINFNNQETIWELSDVKYYNI